jgi:hypothetical protein
LSRNTFISGARLFVVHEAFEMMSLGGVVDALVDAQDDRGVVAGRRRGDQDLLGAGRDVLARVFGLREEAGRFDDDVDAQLAPGEVGGSRSARTLIGLPSTTMESPSSSTVASRRPVMESNLRRCASAALSVRSLTATISMSVPLASAARK